MPRFCAPALLLSLLLPLAAAAQTTPPVSGPDPAGRPRYTLFRPVPRARLRPLSPDRPGVTESPFTLRCRALPV